MHIIHQRRSNMAITIQQVLSYLDTHSLCASSQNLPSLLHTLCNIYNEYNPVEPPQIKAAFDHLDTIIQITYCSFKFYSGFAGVIFSLRESYIAATQQ